MIHKEIQAIFDFIDFLDVNKKEYIDVYLPLCAELETLDKVKGSLLHNENYKQKLQYDVVQKQIEEKLRLVYENVYLAATSKLQNFRIWVFGQVIKVILVLKILLRLPPTIIEKHFK